MFMFSLCIFQSAYTGLKIWDFSSKVVDLRKGINVAVGSEQIFLRLNKNFLATAFAWIQNNLPYNMKKSLTCLLKDTTRIIMPADKNVGITICTKEDYNTGILEQLNDKCFKKLAYRSHANAVAKKFLFNLKNICNVRKPTAAFILSKIKCEIFHILTFKKRKIAVYD
jgi:hypothetical protein